MERATAVVLPVVVIVVLLPALSYVYVYCLRGRHGGVLCCATLDLLAITSQPRYTWYVGSVGEQSIKAAVEVKDVIFEIGVAESRLSLIEMELEIGNIVVLHEVYHTTRHDTV